MERTEAQKYKGMIFAIIGGIFWGLAGVFGQYLFVNHGLNAKWLVSVRLLLAGVMLLIPVMIKEKSRYLPYGKKRKTYLLFFFLLYLEWDYANWPITLPYNFQTRALQR